MRFILAPKVKCDLDEIADWIARENPRHALSVTQTIRSALREIAEQPLHYQLRPDIGEGARLAVIGRYIALFRIHKDMVRFERVVYGGRDLPAVYAARTRAVE